MGGTWSRGDGLERRKCEGLWVAMRSKVPGVLATQDLVGQEHRYIY